MKAKALARGSPLVKCMTLGVVLLSFALALALYPQMPDTMASHWNGAGDVNGYMSKLWGLFLMPVMGLGLWLLFLAVPRMDPLKANVLQFQTHFDRFILAIEAFLLYIYALTLLWSVGTRFNMIQAMVLPLGALFFYVGVLIGHTKRNWFIGIRTPWTLSSDRVWDDTHRIGAKLFKVSGLIALIGFLLPEYAILFILIPVIATAIISIAYSYVDFRKHAR